MDITPKQQNDTQQQQEWGDFTSAGPASASAAPSAAPK